MIPPLRRVVDLRSDAVTKPTDVMREQIFHAVVGDDVMGEDPTVNMLEAKAATMFAKEKALWLPSGTMANLAATMTWCRRDSYMVLGDSSHINLFETNGMSIIAGVIPQTLPNQLDGTIDLQDMKQFIEEKEREAEPTALISIENTHNYCGGRVLPAGYLEQLTVLAQDLAIPLHLDGARIWNAAVASGRSLPELVNGVDSVSVSLSKGLGAPAGDPPSPLLPSPPPPLASPYSRSLTFSLSVSLLHSPSSFLLPPSRSLPLTHSLSVFLLHALLPSPPHPLSPVFHPLSLLFSSYSPRSPPVLLLQVPCYWGPLNSSIAPEKHGKC